MSDPLQQASVAIKSGNAEHARRLLNQLLQAEPDNDQAWVWLARVVTSPEWRRACLERALTINPQSQQAKQALLESIMTADDVSDKTAVPATAPPSPQPPPTSPLSHRQWPPTA